MKVNTDEWKVIKRNGELVDFNAKSIENAIQNAAKDLEVEMVDIDLIMEQIFQEIEENLSEGAIGVEDIQDMVEDHINNLKKFPIARVIAQRIATLVSFQITLNKSLNSISLSDNARITLTLD